MDSKTIEEGKTTAIVSYILLVGVLIALSMNSESKNEFAKFHIKQALGLTLTFIGIGILTSTFNTIFATYGFWIFISVLWTYGIFSAINGNTKPLPLVGEFFQKWFKL